jgi:hypothetical protein
VVKGGEGDEHPKPQEPRLVEEEIPKDQLPLVELCPALESRSRTPSRWSVLDTYATNACAMA